MIGPPPKSPLFPYTTLSGSCRDSATAGKVQRQHAENECSGQNHRSEEYTSELQSPDHLVCRLLLEKKKKDCNRCTQSTASSTSRSQHRPVSHVAKSIATRDD